MRKEQTRKSRTVRRPHRSNPKIEKFVRNAGIFLVSCAVLGCVYMMAAKAARPYMIYLAESKEIKQTEQEQAAALAEHRALEERVRLLKTKQGLEIEARKLGWVKNGEIAVIVDREEKPDLAPKPATGSTSPIKKAEQSIIKVLKRPKPTTAPGTQPVP